MISNYDLDNWFQYHAPTHIQQKQYETIRAAARHLAGVIISNTPLGADQTASIRKLREAVMTANASIACDDTNTEGVAGAMTNRPDTNRA
jgi:hypothetical protein